MTRIITRGALRLAFGLGLLCCALAGHAQSCVTASQVTLTGSLRSANGLPAVNSVITLTPSQVGFIAGCGVNLPQATTCGTSTDGSVIQTPNPLTATVNTSSGSGSLPPATYYTVYEWYDALGHVTLPSPETITILSSTGSLVVNSPASGIPATAVGMNVFIGTSSGGETLQGQTTGSASFVQSSALASGASPATANNTVCVATANDSVWPTGTGYVATMVDINGNPVPGFPMQWQLMGAGSTINLSNGLPYYHGVVTYPVPVLTSPQNHGAQSISGPLSLTGYNLTNVGKLGVGTGTPGWSIDVTNGLVNSDAGYLINGSAPSGTVCAGSTDGVAIDAYLPCNVTPFPTLYYQTIYNGITALPQRLALNVGGTTGLIADDESVGIGPNRTFLKVNATGVLVTDPEVVNAAAAGTAGNCMVWDSAGGAGDNGGPCGVGAFEVGSNGYQVYGSGSIDEWTIGATLGSGDNETPHTTALPHACPTAIDNVMLTAQATGTDYGEQITLTLLSATPGVFGTASVTYYYERNADHSGMTVTPHIRVICH